MDQKHLLFIDSDTCWEYKSERNAVAKLYKMKDGGRRTILVSVRSNFYEIVDSLNLNKTMQVYSMSEVYNYVGGL